jgi:hypothetical protein
MFHLTANSVFLQRPFWRYLITPVERSTHAEINELLGAANDVTTSPRIAPEVMRATAMKIFFGKKCLECIS